MMTALMIIVFTLMGLALLFVARKFYQKSIRTLNRLQMDHVYTNIAHELLTPLTVIAASVEQLRKKEPDHIKDYALMELNVERMTRLIQQILEASKSQAGELRLKVAQGDIIEFIRQTALCIEPLMHKKGLLFIIQCEPKSMMGWIDTDKVDKIIYNLLSNAAKYTRTPGEVRLEVNMSKDYDQVIIKVIDNGIGIPADRLKGIFRRYYDGDYRWLKEHGTGLGLALTRDLVVLHHGTISCESIKGKSTTFTVTLPIRKEAYDVSQIDEEHPIDLSKPQHAIIDVEAVNRLVKPELMSECREVEDQYRILLVEDNEDLLLLMASLLCKNFNVLTARNAQAALDIINQHAVDLIVSDVALPGMDGNELTKTIKSSPEWGHLPIILLSAKTDEEERKASLLVGADDYITKPFRLGDLEVRITNIIENRIRIVGERASLNAEKEPRKLTPDEEFLQRARDCVKKHMDDSEFDRDSFASEMGASASTLYNKLRALTGMNVSIFIRDIRMKEAKRLVETQPDLRVSDLAYMVGFKDPKYFATCFKKEFGIQPSELIATKQKT